MHEVLGPAAVPFELDAVRKVDLEPEVLAVARGESGPLLPYQAEEHEAAVDAPRPRHHALAALPDLPARPTGGLQQPLAPPP